MPYKVLFYECLECGAQHDSWSGAEQCEWEHDYAREEADMTRDDDGMTADERANLDATFAEIHEQQQPSDREA